MQAAYLELKLSWEIFQKAPDTLSANEQTRLHDIVRKQSVIEAAILASPEAGQVVVPAATLAKRLQEIRQRYQSDDDYTQDLQRSGIDPERLASSVERDLWVEAVLERIAARVPAVSKVDAEIYYRLHPEAFDRPEARRLRHILITFNDAAGRAKAQSQLETLRREARAAEAFGQAALRHSQCPTALEGGLLGVVKRNQLYPELEAAAFALVENELSAVLESPVGLHLLRCDEILPSGLLPFAEVCDRIIERLTEKRRQQAQRDWIKALPPAPAGEKETLS